MIYDLCISVYHSVLPHFLKEGIFLTSLFEEWWKVLKISSRGREKGGEDIFFHYFGGGTEIFMIQK